MVVVPYIHNMNKLYLIFSSLLIICKVAYTQEEIPTLEEFAEPKNAVKLVPFQFLFSTFQFDWETGKVPQSSIQITPSLTVLDEGSDKILGGGLGLTKKFYLQPSLIRLQGFYAGAHAAYKYFNIENNINDSLSVINIHAIELHLIMGYQVIVEEIIAVDLYFGGGMRKAFCDKDCSDFQKIFNIGYSGINPKIGFSIGIYFSSLKDLSFGSGSSSH